MTHSHLPAESGNDREPNYVEHRLRDEGDVEFWGRHTRQKLERYEEAAANTAKCRANRSNREVMRRMETAQRQAAFHLEGAAKTLYDTVCETFKRHQESQ